MDGFIHNILIGIHALGGVAAFITGAIVLVPPVLERANRRRFFNVFLVALALLLVPLYLVIALDWPGLDFVRQVTFSFLGVLGLYMAYRAFRARQVLLEQSEGWKPRYMDHMGFNLIALFEGFVIVLAIDLGAQIGQLE